MKSVSYRVCRSMRNLDDCLDYARQHRPLRVEVQRETSDWPGELDVFRQWSVRMRWRFPDAAVDLVRVYGWLSTACEPRDLRAAGIRAERRLRRDLARMAKLPVVVGGENWVRTRARAKA